MESDFGEFGSIMAAEELGEVILEHAEFEGLGLGSTPFGVAATGSPIGDVAGGDVQAEVAEGGGNFMVGDVVGEHAVDHLAFEFREVGDLAVTRLAVRAVLKRLERSGAKVELEGQKRAFRGGIRRGRTVLRGC